MSRSARKGPFIEKKLLEKVEAARRSGQTTVIKTWSRSSVVMPQMIGMTIGVYDGRRHVAVFVTENMVGHRMGEFAPTRLFRGHVARVQAAAAAPAAPAAPAAK
ncbi:MAG: 30S ribosomal protein S19 [Chloroflexi bacterium]|nr:30S ribosomal protein S19 [Chloroflexota bacterium]